jgi:hypothetical protein
MMRVQTWATRFTPFIITCMTLAMVIWILWAPFGVHTVGLIEEWSNKQQLIDGYPFYALPINEWQINRVLLMLPFLMAEWFGHDHFIGNTVLTMLAFFAKGLAMFTLVRQLLPAQPWLATAAALVLLIQPGNESTMPTRLFTYHIVIFAYLAATSCLVAFWRTRDWRYWWLLVPCMLLCVGIVESIFPLLGASPLLLLWMERAALRHDPAQRWPILRRWGFVSILWYALPLAFGLWFVYLIATRQLGYQNMLIERMQTSDAGQPGLGPLIALRPYWFMLVGGWARLDVGWVLNLLCIAGGVAAGAAVWHTMPKNVTATPAQRAGQYYVLGLGMAAIPLGFALYLLVEHRVSSDYVFFFSTIGAAIVWAVWLWLLAQRRRAMRLWYVGGVGVLVAVGINVMHGQQVYYYSLGMVQSNILVQVAQQAPNPSTSLQIITFERNGYASNIWMFGLSSTTAHYSDAFRWLYNNSGVDVTMCYQPHNTVQVACDFRADGVQITRNPTPSTQITTLMPYADLLALQINTDGSVSVLQTLPAEFVGDLDIRGYDATAALARAQGSLPPRAQYLRDYVLPAVGRVAAR